MAELPLDQAVTRFKGNEDRVNQFVNAPNGEEEYETTGGERVPVLPKLLPAVTTLAQQTAESAQRAETSAIASIAGSQTYADTTAALANTADGQYFLIRTENAQIFDVWLNNAGTAVDQFVKLDFASTAQVEKIYETVTPIDSRGPFVYEFLDKKKERVGGFGAYGDFQASSFSDLMVFAPPSAVSEYHNPRVVAQILSLDKKIIGRDLTDGSKDRFLEPEPEPTPEPSVVAPAPIYAGYRLREYRRKRQQIKAGVDGTRLTVACIGDSWTDNRANWLSSFSEQLKNKYGNAGQFFGAGGLWGGASDALSGSMTVSAGWTVINFTVPTPHLRAVETSTAGEVLTINDAEAESARVCYLGGNGVARYRYIGGDWHSITLDGTGTQWKDLVAPPSGKSIFQFEVVSGTCRVYGFSLDNAEGIKTIKMAASSTRASQWTAVDRQQWVDAITPLDIDVAVIMFGTNDIYGYNAETFVTVHLPELVSRVREAAPNADILIASPPVNLADNVPGTDGQNLPAFAAASRIWAETNNAAHLDVQFYFGVSPEDYGDAGSQYIMAADAFHPAPNGQAVLAECMLTTLEQS